MMVAPFGYRRFNHFNEKVVIGAGGIHCGEFAAFNELLRISNRLAGNLKYFRAAFAQLMLQMDIG
jgi:hypothetical protein